MSERGKLSVYLGQHLTARFGGLFKSVEASAPRALTIFEYLGFPLSSGLHVVNTEHASRVALGNRLVAMVLRTCSKPEIFYPVIGSDAVSMVDNLSGPLAVVMAPSQNMSAVNVAFELDADVSQTVHDASDLSYPLGIPEVGIIGSVTPAEHTCQWVVVQHGTNEFAGQRRLAGYWHEVFVRLIQWIGFVSNLPLRCKPIMVGV